MINIAVILVIALLAGLMVSGVIYIDVFKIRKLINNETSVDMIEFDKCVLPYKRDNYGERNIR